MLPEVSAYTVTVQKRIWLSPTSFERRFSKPLGYTYLPGQKVSCTANSNKREYTLVSAPGDESLAICVKKVGNGGMVHDAFGYINGALPDTLVITETFFTE